MLTQKVKNWGHGLSIEEDFDEEDIILTLLETDEKHVHQTENLGFPAGDDDIAYSFLVDIKNEEVMRREQWRPSHYSDRALPNRLCPGVGQRTITLHYHDPKTNFGRGSSEVDVFKTVVKPTLGPDDRALLDAGVARDRVESVKRAFRQGDKYEAAEAAIRDDTFRDLEEEREFYDKVVEIFS